MTGVTERRDVTDLLSFPVRLEPANSDALQQSTICMYHRLCVIGRVCVPDLSRHAASGLVLYWLTLAARNRDRNFFAACDVNGSWSKC